MSEIEVTSDIDTSEPDNPILRTLVKSKYGTRTYSMSLQSVREDKRDWCNHVVTSNIRYIANQIEADTKRGIKDMVVDTFSYLGLKFS